VLTCEGVFGLRRAFVLAGAQTLVMSLWKVPDEQTKDLMVDFYNRLLIGRSRAQALREAQLAMKEKYTDPYYWGALICQGNPGPLSNRYQVSRYNAGDIQQYTHGINIPKDVMKSSKKIVKYNSDGKPIT